MASRTETGISPIAPLPNPRQAREPHTGTRTALPLLAFGCSAGRPRSAVLVEELARRLAAEGIACCVEHCEGVRP